MFVYSSHTHAVARDIARFYSVHFASVYIGTILRALKKIFRASLRSGIQRIQVIIKLQLGLLRIFSNGFTDILSAIMQLQNHREIYHFVF